ncbi:MAG TPA: terpene cyclase/mutase family protein [Caldilineae bacterium]|nr:terpene cyclase/mutase family protein [Caldilineae bacterium]
MRSSRHGFIGYLIGLAVLLIGISGWPSAIGADGGTPRTTAAPRRFAVARALGWLHAQQRDDGSFGGVLTTTADVVYAAALAGEDPDGPSWTPGPRSLLDALRELSQTQATNAGRVGKALRALGVAGYTTADPTVAALVAKLDTFYDPATGLYSPTQGFYHALAVEGLARVGASVPSKAIDALLVRQKADGGWGWAFGQPESASDVDTTGQVMRALRAAGISPNHPAMVKAVAFLAARQRADGGWAWGEAAGSSDGNATALALAGLIAADVDPLAPPFADREPTALGFILDLQQPSGAFAYLPDRPEDNLMATLDIIPALSPAWPGDHALPIRGFLPNVYMGTLSWE